jgi:hypothetical protein
MIKLSILKEFSKTPGFRFKKQSPGTSGQEFRDNLLIHKYIEALSKKEKLSVDLDGTDGYLTSFLEEAFGGLQRLRKELGENVLDHIEIISNDEPHWIEDIQRYVNDELAKKN